jgi:hypothetical protein
MRQEGGGRDMLAVKARDKGSNNQPFTGAAKTRRWTMDWVEDAATNHLWEKQAVASNESKRTAADNGRQKWAVAINNRVKDCTTTAGANKIGWQQYSR